MFSSLPSERAAHDAADGMTSRGPDATTSPVATPGPSRFRRWAGKVALGATAVAIGIGLLVDAVRRA